MNGFEYVIFWLHASDQQMKVTPHQVQLVKTPASKKNGAEDMRRIAHNTCENSGR